MEVNLIDESIRKDINEIKLINIEEINLFSDEVKTCKTKICQYYNKNWRCPSVVKDGKSIREKVKNYKRALVFNTVHKLEDCFDIEAMRIAKVNHDKSCNLLKASVKRIINEENILLLGQGACTMCSQCSYVDKLPCRFPEESRDSMESCGIDIINLTRECKLNYMNGENTVTYFGLILF